MKCVVVNEPGLLTVRRFSVALAVLALTLSASGCGALKSVGAGGQPAPTSAVPSEQPSDQDSPEEPVGEPAKWLLTPEDSGELLILSEVDITTERPANKQISFPIEIPDPSYLEADYRKECKAAVEAMQTPQSGVHTVVTAEYTEDPDWQGSVGEPPKARVIAFQTDEDVNIMEVFRLPWGTCPDERGEKPSFYEYITPGGEDMDTFVYMHFSDGEGMHSTSYFGVVSRGKNHIFIQVDNIDAPTSAPFIKAQIEKFKREAA